MTVARRIHPTLADLMYLNRDVHHEVQEHILGFRHSQMADALLHMSERLTGREQELDIQRRVAEERGRRLRLAQEVVHQCGRDDELNAKVLKP
jgi:hypothetical protein